MRPNLKGCKADPEARTGSLQGQKHKLKLIRNYVGFVEVRNYFKSALATIETLRLGLWRINTDIMTTVLKKFLRIT
jgi:hypothetical protein